MSDSNECKPLDYERAYYSLQFFMRRQVGWMYALSRGMEDHAPCAASAIESQCRIWNNELAAIENGTYGSYPSPTSAASAPPAARHTERPDTTHS